MLYISYCSICSTEHVYKYNFHEIWALYSFKNKHDIGVYKVMNILLQALEIFVADLCVTKIEIHILIVCGKKEGWVLSIRIL